ncbi:LysE family translocator [Rhizobium halophytocola]|uniref:Threonine/homoserine/homoserine lactone efflux protein n=1 Tax=Rhizobium halophytocola TaxID=735519 RepID=A0ABS4E143_9HYPH|nr:LysE family translocator [Rhizobium halophytocola]MBP1851655.1 threonine/homoserine/homoserine lactone efflux protein [Rhizobium halophytocola]
MSLSGLLIFAGALFVAAGSPGPNIAALVARVLAKGIRDVLPFLVAMWIGEAIWLTFAVVGLTAIAATLQPLFLTVKWAGIVYLLYLAWKMWTSRPEPETDTMPQRSSPWRMFAAGMAVALGNPKIMIFYIALLPAIIDLSHVDFIGWAELTATMLVVLVTVDAFWALLAGHGRRYIRNARTVRLVNRASAGLMATAAAAIAVRG